MRPAVGIVAGFLFGAGLLVSGMYDPANVVGFLDLAGSWNPSLAFVMAGAIGAAAPAFAWIRRTGRDLSGATVRLPDRRSIGAQLVFGSAAFGIGWGITGLCPGPALVDLDTGAPYVVAFVVAMSIGLVVSAWLKASRGALPIGTSAEPAPLEHE
jgi:uncharacterized protein